MIASTTEWGNVTLPIQPAASLTVAIAGNDHLTIGTPRVTFGPTTLAIDVQRQDDGLLITLDDVPQGATIVVPVRARTPINTSSTTLDLTLGKQKVSVPIELTGEALFLEPRSKWSLPDTVILDTDTTLTLQLRNDGTADAEDVTIRIPLVPGLHLSGDSEGKIVVGAGGDLTLVLDRSRIAVGERAEFPLTLTWGDAALDAANVTASVTSANSADTAFTAALQRTTNGTVKIAAKPRQKTAHVGQPVRIDVTIDNADRELHEASCILEGDGLAPKTYSLGTILPLERRSFTIASALARIQHREWQIPFRLHVQSGSNRAASTDGTLTGIGEARLNGSIDVTALDGSFARAITVTVVNNGTGATNNATATIELPSGVRPVIDSLRVDGKRLLSLDGSVPDTVALGTIVPGDSRTFTLRARAADDVLETVAVALSYDDVLTRIETPSAIDFPNARGRAEEEEPAPAVATAPALPVPNEILNDIPWGTDREFSALLQTSLAETQEAGVATGAAEEEESDGAGEGAGEDTAAAAAPTVPDVAMPTYRDSFSPQFEVLVPLDADGIELGRLVLGLFDFLPLTLPNAETELTNLRVATNAIVERYLPSIRQGTFGASGYALVTAKAVDALRVLRDRLGESPLDPHVGDRAALLALLELVDASGDIQGEVRKLNSFVTGQVRNIEDEESLGNVIPIMDIAA
jgi:hypothetical protein